MRLIAALSQNANAWGDLYWDDGESLDTFAKGDYSYLVFNVTQVRCSVASCGVEGRAPCLAGRNPQV